MRLHYHSLSSKRRYRPLQNFHDIFGGFIHPFDIFFNFFERAFPSVFSLFTCINKIAAASFKQSNRYRTVYRCTNIHVSPRRASLQREILPLRNPDKPSARELQTFSTGYSLLSKKLFFRATRPPQLQLHNSGSKF